MSTSVLSVVILTSLSTILVCLTIYAYLTCTVSAMLMHTAASAAKATPVDIMSDMSEGDIVFFSCQPDSDIVTKMCAVYCRSCFYHVGIVVVLGDGVKCLLHFVDPVWRPFYGRCHPFPPSQQQDTHGAPDLCISDLGSLVNKYPPATLLCICKNSERRHNSSSSKELLEAARSVSRDKRYPPNLFLSFLYALTSPLLSSENVKGTLHCNSFIGLLLEELEILDKSDEDPDIVYIPGKLLARVARVYQPKIVCIHSGEKRKTE